jgi:hypothetical protein
VTGTGPVIGVTGDVVVAQAPCRAEACAVVGVDLASGRSTELATGVRAAALGGDGDGTLVIDTATGGVSALDVATRVRSEVRDAAGALPVRRSSMATSGAASALGAVLLAPGGRVTDPSAAVVFDPAARSARSLGEVIP